MKKKTSGGKGKGRKTVLNSPRRKGRKIDRPFRAAASESNAGKASKASADLAIEREGSQAAELIAEKADKLPRIGDEPGSSRPDHSSGGVEALPSPDLEMKTETATALSVDLEEAEEFLAFYLGNEEYAVDIMNIREIIVPVGITSVPKTPTFIKGIISLRGTIIPVFDLRIRLGLPETASRAEERFLVFGLIKGLMAVIADRVTEVVRIRKNDLEPPPGAIGGTSSEHITGMTHFEGRLIILLDVEKAVGIA